MSTFTASLQAYFTSSLMGQRAASQHTIAAYRDTFKLLLTYMHEKKGLAPDAVEFTDLNAETVSAFLHHLETERHNSVRTRNARLAAIHSFLAHAAFDHPEHADVIARTLAIKTKNTTTPVLAYLTAAEVDALLKAPDRTTRTGNRDHVMILVLVTTGLRVSELTALTRQDLQLNKPAHLLCHGKGRKDRVTPLTQLTAASLRQWIEANPAGNPASPVFTAQGSSKAISRDAIAARLRVHAMTAATSCPSLATKNVTPHTLRHTTAMRMIEAGIDITTIALWLGHESIQATQAYLHADLGMKQRALDRLTPPETKGKRFAPKGNMLAFLEGL